MPPDVQPSRCVPLASPLVATTATTATSAATESATSRRASDDVLVIPSRLTPVSASTARTPASRSAQTGPETAYAANVSAIAAHEAVLPTTNPQPARNPHHSPSRSRP